jgi:hypothetical protein
MTPYITLTLVAVGFLGVCLPLVLYWDRKDERQS